MLACPSLVALTAKLGYSPIKSFRYLLQDSPAGFFGTEQFVEGFRYLGARGYAFDMTLDVTHEQTGRTKILQDAIDVIERVHRGQAPEKQTRFIFGALPQRCLPSRCAGLCVWLTQAPGPFPATDHFAKPSLTADLSYPPPAHHTAYLEALYQLALVPHTYLKLSALLDSLDGPTARAAFGEFKSGEYRKRRRDGAYERIKARFLSVLEPAIEAFGDERILVGSGALAFLLLLSGGARGPGLAWLGLLGTPALHPIAGLFHLMAFACGGCLETATFARSQRNGVREADLPSLPGNVRSGLDSCAGAGVHRLAHVPCDAPPGICDVTLARALLFGRPVRGSPRVGVRDAALPRLSRPRRPRRRRTRPDL